MGDARRSGRTEPAGGNPADVTLRVDAERNRSRIVAAARTLYADQGLTISMASVARQAGVGKATMSRHFSDQAQLISAVFADRMLAYVELTERALDRTDHWRAFVDYIVAVCEMQAGDRGFADVLTLTFPGETTLEDLRTRGYVGFVELIRRAKATGHLRRDFRSEDLVVLLMANAGLVNVTHHDAPDSWRRLVGQVLRGFASPGAPLPKLPPAPPSDDLVRAMTRAASPAAD